MAAAKSRARKTSALPTRIWKFTARPVDERATLGVMWSARRYYNALVSIERDRSSRFAAIRRRHAPELAALEDAYVAADDEIERLYAGVRTSRQVHWQDQGGEKRRLLPPESLARLATLEAERARVSAAAKAHRAAFAALLAPGNDERKRRSTERAGDGAGPATKSAANAAVLAEMLSEPQWGEVWREIAESDAGAHGEMIAARARCGLATGTYLAVEEAVARAKKDSAPRPPRFKRGPMRSGKIQVQLHGTWACPGAKLVVEQLPPDPTKKGRHEYMRRVLIDQDNARTSINRKRLEFTARIDREPPHDAAIKWAAIVARRDERGWRFELQLTLEHASFAEPKIQAGLRAPEHIAIGWTRVDGGIRVAHWPGGEVMVPDSILAQGEHADAIDVAGERLLNRAKRLIRCWTRLGGNRLRLDLVKSDERRSLLRRVCKDYASHQFGERLRDLWVAWRNDRLSRGEDLYAAPWLMRRWLRDRGVTASHARMAFWCYVWARKDEHMQAYASAETRRAINRRTELFRREARRIASEFASVTVDSYTIAALRKLPPITLPGERPREISQHNATAAAPGEFREVLLAVMGPRVTKGFV